MFFKNNNLVGLNEEKVINKENNHGEKEIELIDNAINRPKAEENNNLANINEEVIVVSDMAIEKVKEEVETTNWLTLMEEKIALLKDLEKDKQEKEAKQSAIKDKIEAIKEELAELQLSHEKAKDELEEIELKWSLEKEALQEIAINC